jgi:hypothetical protein
MTLVYLIEWVRVYASNHIGEKRESEAESSTNCRPDDQEYIVA